MSQPVGPHTDSENTGGWVLNPAVSDEFDGTALDAEKWMLQGKDGHFENRFVGRAPAQFSPNNVSVSDGFLRINTRWEPDYDFSDKVKDGRKFENITTGAIISRAKFLHGYMEIRCKAADGPISSSFWTTGEGGELDVFEHWGRSDNGPSDKRYHTSFHDWRVPGSATYGKRIWTNDHLLDFSVQDGFHIYGLEWNPAYLKVYADGYLVRYVTRAEVGEEKWVVVNGQKVWLDCEVFPWVVDPTSLSESDYTTKGIDFIVDYVRIWQTDGPAPDLQVKKNMLSNPGFEDGLTNWVTRGEAQIVDEGGRAGKAAHLTTPGIVRQSVTVKPNTMYVLSAEAKLPGTGGGTWHRSWLGVADPDGEEIRYQFFHSDYYRRSLQFKTGPTTTKMTVFFTNDESGHPSSVDRFELIESAKLSATPTPTQIVTSDPKNR